MLTQFFSCHSPPSPGPQEGDIYKSLHIYGQRFELAYGYYEACERDNPLVEPMPIYPDFLRDPRYTKEGFPFVTKMQDVCPHFAGERSCFSECADCRFYSHGEDLIGICICPQNQQKNGGQDDGSE